MGKLSNSIVIGESPAPSNATYSKIVYFRKHTAFLQALESKNGKLHRIKQITKKHFFDNVHNRNIKKTYECTYMVQWDKLSVRREDLNKFEEIRAKYGDIDKYKLFKLMVEDFYFKDVIQQ